MREHMICPACWRFRWSPLHWFVRLAGLCDGKGSWL